MSEFEKVYGEPASNVGITADGVKSPFDIVEARQRQAELTVFDVPVTNMATVHKFGDIKFDAGTEDPRKRKHIHVKLPNGASTKFWIELNGLKNIEHIPSSTLGVFNVDIKIVEEQIEVYYDDIIKNYNHALNNEPFQPTKGKQTKGKNSPKAVEARKATQAQTNPPG